MEHVAPNAPTGATAELGLTLIVRGRSNALLRTVRLARTFGELIHGGRGAARRQTGRSPTSRGAPLEGGPDALDSPPARSPSAPRIGSPNHRLCDRASGPDQAGLHGPAHRRDGRHRGPVCRAGGDSGRLGHPGEECGGRGEHRPRGESRWWDALRHAHGGGDPRDRHVHQPANRSASQWLHARGVLGLLGGSDERGICRHTPPDLRLGQHGRLPHLRGYDRGRRVLLGRQPRRPARRRDHDQPVDPGGGSGGG